MKVTDDLVQRFRSAYQNRVGWSLLDENIRAALEETLGDVPEPDIYWHGQCEEAEGKLDEAKAKLAAAEEKLAHAREHWKFVAGGGELYRLSTLGFILGEAGDEEADE